MSDIVDKLRLVEKGHEAFALCYRAADRIEELEAALQNRSSQITDHKRLLADLAHKARAFDAALSSDCDCEEREALREAVHVLIGD